MLWTLQWYIFRELGRTFLLTAVALTVILGMGGGVLNMIGLERVTVGQLLRMMTIILPLAGTMALPIAALFSAAITYGRFSAANEFVACRSSGINIHLLFAPTVAISLVSALFTFGAINYLIPGRVRNLDRFLRADLAQIVAHQLQAPGRLPLRKDRFRIYGESAHSVDEPDLPADSEKLRIDKVAFAEMDKGKWMRYGTAGAVQIRFDHLRTTPSLRVELTGVSFYDRANSRYAEHAREDFALDRIPQKFELKVKWLDLSELFFYLRQPGSLPDIQEELGRARAVLARERFYRSLAVDFGKLDDTGQPDCELTFGDREVEYTLQAEEMVTDSFDSKPTFTNVRLVERVGSRIRHAVAEAGTIDIHTQPGQDFGKAYVELTDGVTITDGADPSQTITRSRLEFPSVALPDHVVRQVTSISDQELLAPDSEIASRRAFAKRRAAVVEKRDELAREILGVIHARLAFSVSAFVLVVLAAALGIVFRGSHVLTAFGISFIPSLVVITSIIMGRQMTQNAATTMIGVVTIWAGIMLVGVLDVWTLTRVLRR